MDTAKGILEGRIADPTGGAVWFHHGPRSPWFSNSMIAGTMVDTGAPLGDAKFYRPPAPKNDKPNL